TRGIGGGPANVISALARLKTGLRLWPMGAIGDDDYGAFILAECRKLDLPTETLRTKAAVATAHTHVMSVSGRSRTFFYQGGANDTLSVEDFPVGTFADSDARLFYLGYLTLLEKLDTVDETGTTGALQVLSRAKAAGLVTCVDLVSMPRPDFRDIVEATAPQIDYLIMNEIEAGFATGLDGNLADAEALNRMANALLRLGVRKAVVVHCVERVVWASADGEVMSVDVKTIPSEEIASNLGAGDAFCAGLLYGVHEGWSPAEAIDLAVRTAHASLKGHTATEAIPSLSELKGTV
ncbi:MAG: carbohydrate kinase family protein, partial [Pseudomonadota bacterium]